MSCRIRRWKDRGGSLCFTCWLVYMSIRMLLDTWDWSWRHETTTRSLHTTTTTVVTFSWAFLNGLTPRTIARRFRCNSRQVYMAISTCILFIQFYILFYFIHSSIFNFISFIYSTLEFYFFLILYCLIYNEILCILIRCILSIYFFPLLNKVEDEWDN